jgi:hypothetical protein
MRVMAEASVVIGVYDSTSTVVMSNNHTLSIYGTTMSVLIHA